jgi:hypothetical protein
LSAPHSPFREIQNKGGLKRRSSNESKVVIRKQLNELKEIKI